MRVLGPALRMRSRGSADLSGESWIVASLGADRVQKATDEAELRRLSSALGTTPSSLQNDDQLRFAANVLNSTCWTRSRSLASAFQIARGPSPPESPVERAESLVRLGCLGILGDRVPTFKAFSATRTWGGFICVPRIWGDRVWTTVLHAWLLLFRKNGRDDFDAVQAQVAALRSDQNDQEPGFLQDAAEREDATPGWELSWCYTTTSLSNSTLSSTARWPPLCMVDSLGRRFWPDCWRARPKPLSRAASEGRGLRL